MVYYCGRLTTTVPLHDILNQAGLNEREASAYLALLELGESSVSQVGLRSGIERTYCYDILESLVKKDLANVLEKNGRRRYLAADPKTLTRLLEQRLAVVREGMPELQAHQNTDGQRPTVRFYEGQAAINNLYQELLVAKEYDAIVSPAALYQAMGEQIDLFAVQVVARGTKARELVTAESGLPEYARHFKKPLQEARLLPKTVSISTDTLIFENKVVSVAYTPVPHAIVTEGSEIVATQKALFEFMWRAAKG